MQPCWKSKTPRKKGMGRMPLWENDNAYAHLGDRHSRCDARECLCPQGREHREGRGSWQLFLCRSCAAEGTHRGCFGLRTSGSLWECDSCAGLGTGERQGVSRDWGRAGPGSGTWAGLGRASLLQQTLCSI
nr:PHD finger protein 7-like isoform X2 [Columba livia]